MGTCRDPSHQVWKCPPLLMKNGRTSMSAKGHSGSLREWLSRGRCVDLFRSEDKKKSCAVFVNGLLVTASPAQHWGTHFPQSVWPDLLLHSEVYSVTTTLTSGGGWGWGGGEWKTFYNLSCSKTISRWKSVFPFGAITHLSLKNHPAHSR